MLLAAQRGRIGELERVPWLEVLGLAGMVVAAAAAAAAAAAEKAAEEKAWVDMGRRERMAETMETASSGSLRTVLMMRLNSRGGHHQHINRSRVVDAATGWLAERPRGAWKCFARLEFPDCSIAGQCSSCSGGAWWY